MKATISGSTGFSGKVSLQKILLVCGILSSLFYAGMDVFAGSRWQGYSFANNAFSDLSSIGAPSRPTILLLSPIYAALVIAFGLGVWWSAGRKRSLRAIGGLLVAYALVSLVWPQFFPEDLTGSMSAFTNTMHIILAGVSVLLFLLQLGFGTFALGKWFRIYSIGTILLLLVFGAYTAEVGAQFVSGQRTPGFGVEERILIYGYMLWVLVLAVVLLRAERGGKKL